MKNKKYIRSFDVNKTTKSNLIRLWSCRKNSIAIGNIWIDKLSQFNAVAAAVDCAVRSNRSMQHYERPLQPHTFHVRMDWSIADAAEDLAQSLRYISKDLYEKGDKYAEDIQKKFFDYWSSGDGRRQKNGCHCRRPVHEKDTRNNNRLCRQHEARSLIRISERGLSKAVLMKFPAPEIEQMIESNGLTPRSFKKNYIVDTSK